MIRKASIATVSVLATGVACLAQDEPPRKHAGLQVGRVADTVAGAPSSACNATAASLVVGAAMPPYERRALRLHARLVCVPGVKLSVPSCATAEAVSLTQ